MDYPDEAEQEPKINFISCVCFVPRGVAKENPEKVTLTREELARIIKDTKQEIDESEDVEEGAAAETVDGGQNNDSIEIDNEDSNRMDAETSNEMEDEFKFDQYDQEVSTQIAALADIAIIDDNDGLNDNDDENDSEAEDDIIKPNDNLILVGHVQDSIACLEVYVYNEFEDSLYVHHDFLLPSYPLCIEWMHYDPETKEPGNMCAIGSMEPIITIWDLDIADSLEPTLKFGSKGSRKRKLEKYGHKDAVLDLSWNRFFPHILASGSVDQTVILWDMDEGKPHTTITSFQEKVQSIEFHSKQTQLLLTGCCDGTIKLFDCRDPSEISQNMKIWNVNGEIEKVKWDTLNPDCFFAATNKGKMNYFDIRQDSGPLWSKKMHEQEISGVALNEQCKGLLSTTSSDGNLKIWKYNETKSSLVYEDALNIGQIQCMASCMENQFTVAIGGDFKKKQFKVVDVRNYDSVLHKFEIEPTTN